MKINKHKLSRLQELLQEMTQSGNVSGASCLIIQGGEEQAYYEAGLRDIASGLPMTRDTLFRLYSMTKPVTAVAAMILLEEGRIDLADPVSDYLPSFRNQQVMADNLLVSARRPATIQDLLNMTSGLTYPGESSVTEARTALLMNEVIDKLSTSHALTTQEIVTRLGEIPLAFHPGEKWHYGMSADVLGAVIEIVSGMRFGEFLKERIFMPLGMKDTDFYVPADKQYRLAKVYQESPDGLTETACSHLGISNNMENPPAFESGGAGLVSTIDDYARFTQMLLHKGTWENTQILSPRTVDFLSQAHLDTSLDHYVRQWESLAGCSYGNLMRHMIDPGEAITLCSPGEYGWDGWLGVYMTVDPADDLTFLYMQQKTDTGTTAYTRRIRNVIFSSLE